MGVGVASAVITIPVLLVDDLPRAWELWRCAVGAIGGKPVEITAVVVSGLLFALGAFGPLLLRRREATRTRAVGAVAPQPDTADYAPILEHMDRMVEERFGQGLIDRLSKLAAHGSRLAGEANALEPIGPIERVDDFVRRYNDWEAAGSDELLAATGRLGPEWRDAWLRGPDDHSSDMYPITREDLDAMARMIGWRVRLLNEACRALREAERE